MRTPVRKNTRIVFVDEHVLIAETWASLICRKPGYSVVAFYTNTTEFMSELLRIKPDIVLLDVNSHPKSGLDILPDIKKQAPDCRVIGVSLHNHPAVARLMKESGAAGYLTKDSAVQEIYEALQQVSVGKVYFSHAGEALLSI